MTWAHFQHHFYLQTPFRLVAGLSCIALINLSINKDHRL
jgi:hypothetical protein